MRPLSDSEQAWVDSFRPKGTSGATPEPRFEAAIWPDDPWPVEIERVVETPLDWGFPGPIPIFRVRRLDTEQTLWVRANHLYILPNAPERSAS